MKTILENLVLRKEQRLQVTQRGVKCQIKSVSADNDNCHLLLC